MTPIRMDSGSVSSVSERMDVGGPDTGFAEKLSVVIPAFNEGLAIGDFLAKLSAEPALAQAELIVVDDGSGDDTAQKVAAFDRVHLIRHSLNRGYGAALTTGMRHASRDFVVWVDSDGQHRLEDLVSVARELVTAKLDYCIGVRGTNSHHDPSRKLGKWILRLFVQIAAGRNITDFNSGLRGFRREVISRYLHLLPRGFGASTTTTLLMMEGAYLGRELPIIVQARIGKSSVRQLRDGMRTLALVLRIFLLFKPLQFFGSIGLALTLSGLAYGLGSALSSGLGFPVLGAVVLLSGLQTLFIGLVMDQISAMRRERLE